MHLNIEGTDFFVPLTDFARCTGVKGLPRGAPLPMKDQYIHSLEKAQTHTLDSLPFPLNIVAG